MKWTRLVRAAGAFATCTVTVVGIAACGSSSSNSSSSAGASTAAASTASSASAPASSGAPSSSVLGSPNPAKGTPVKFGMINVETNAGADFPEVRESEQAAIDYVNQYRGGLDGHPIQLIPCITDGQPSTSASCATKLISDHPVADIGGADIGQAASLPILAKAGIAQIGGVDLTPAESSSPDSIIFADVAQTGNSDMGVYAFKDLHAKKVAVIAIGDTQGIFQAQHGELPAVKASGGQAKLFPLPPTEADASSVVSSALAYSPDVVEIESPSQCVAILNALKSLGNTKPVMSIDPCSAPPVLTATAGAANGMLWFQPFDDLFVSTSPDAALAKAILAKYAPAKMPVDSPALAGMASVMNIWSTFHTTPVTKLTSAYMLKTLKSGSAHPNFLASPYTCNGTAIPTEKAVCDAGQQLYQIKNNQPALVSAGPYTAGVSLAG
jgi:branched-chain amino acid transport system substrate-binding protein